MAQLLLLTNALTASAEVLPALGLLAHHVRVLPAEPAALIDAPRADAVLVDARRELAVAKSLCRVLRATGIETPLLAVLTEGGLVAVNAEWGLDVRETPVARDNTSGSFSPVSWENAGDYTSDLLLYDTRAWTTPLAQVERDHPTVATLNAVARGHVVDWTTDATFNYASYTKQIALLTDAVKALPASE